MQAKTLQSYYKSYSTYKRWPTQEVEIGNIKLGANNPIRLQSMSSRKPIDTIANIEQSIRIIDAGGEMVRFTAPVVKDAENLKNISDGLRKRGYNQPLVADIHFNPKAALTAAEYVEKVRINPGNFAEISSSKINYTSEEYTAALKNIEDKFVELIQKCKTNNVALRIGSNHGSLSQRIMDRYGDTAIGMVESAMEYLLIAVKHDFYNIVLSMKASNIRVMVPAYRMLVARMREENMNFPLHLGVTEAGEGEDGRIKSAAGIGSLLEDGFGDTIRVSLTEEPEYEIPVAKIIADRYNNKISNGSVSKKLPYDPFQYNRRVTYEINGIGGETEFSVITHDWVISDKSNINDANKIFISKKDSDIKDIQHLSLKEYFDEKPIPNMCFVKVSYEDFISEKIFEIDQQSKVVLVFEDNTIDSVLKYRNMFIELINREIKFPVILKHSYQTNSEEILQINAAVDFAALLIDGLGDGIWIENEGSISKERINEISLGILQATRSRITKTDYISCPSCGRTLFNIQAATHKIREKTSHLKGLKIAVMGCIVNGPGEMADADYGYVGAGAGKINLYKKKEVIKKGISEDEAVESLIEQIKLHGDWVDKNIEL